MDTVLSFHVGQAVLIGATPHRVWSAIIEQTSRWWGSPYLLIDDAGTRLQVEARLGGQVREVAGDHQASWGTITEIDPGRVLTWTGQMGMGGAVTGSVEYHLDPVSQGTRVTVTHNAIGTFGPRAVDTYDYGWADLQARLRAWVQDGVAYGVAGANTAPEFTFEPTQRGE